MACVVATAAMQASPAMAQQLSVWAEKSRLAAHPLPACLVWNHSVSGGLVADCFDHADGVLILRRSYLHDFAAGLGEVAGRGHLTQSPDGGYWIEGIDEPLPDGLVLRLGGARVAHRLGPDPGIRAPSEGDALPISEFRGRVTLRLDP